jgi:cytochrome c5
MERLRLPILAALAASACAPVAQGPGPGQQLVEQKCSTCHNLDVAVSGERDAEGWAEILEAMVGHGMVASPEQLRQMRDYLASRR